MDYDAIVLGNSVLSIVAHRILASRFSTIRIGVSKPFMDRFIILTPKSERILTDLFGKLPTNSINYLKVMDEKGKIYDKIALDGFSSIRYSTLLKLLREKLQEGYIEEEVIHVHPEGEVITRKKRFRASRMIVSTFSTERRKKLLYKHAKTFFLDFWKDVIERDAIYQVNARGYYGIVVPLSEKESAIAYTYETSRVLEKLFSFKPSLSNGFKVISYWSYPYRKGKVIYIGEAVRRFHPHTAQGLNRALYMLSKIEGIGLVHAVSDFIMFVGGILLDNIWGRSMLLSRMMYALLKSGLLRRFL